MHMQLLTHEAPPPRQVDLIWTSTDHCDKSRAPKCAQEWGWRLGFQFVWNTTMGGVQGVLTAQQPCEWLLRLLVFLSMHLKHSIQKCKNAGFIWGVESWLGTTLTLSCSCQGEILSYWVSSCVCMVCGCVYRLDVEFLELLAQLCYLVYLQERRWGSVTENLKAWGRAIWSVP